MIPKLILAAACLVLVPVAPAVGDGNPYKHWAKHQEKLWKEQAKYERELLKAQRKHAKEARKHEEKLFKEWGKLQRERARWGAPAYWFDDTAPRFGDTWPEAEGPFSPHPQHYPLHEYAPSPAPDHRHPHPPTGPIVPQW